MTITVGTDSFISIDDADAYMASRLNGETWPSHLPLQIGVNSSTGEPEYECASPSILERKERTLKTATAILNRESYVGYVTTASQALAWPRTGVCDRERRPVAPTAIPKEIAHATAELALFLLRHDTTDEAVRRWFLRLQSERIGEAEATFRPGAPDNLPAIVRTIIAPFLNSGGHSVSLIA